ncbi:MAG: hypothetical protein EAZ44_03745 [Cytophagia bacterium]|nr:MAG: hypothetical protein EAZ44_03745 [Cytophagia bacterium]
MFNNTPASSRPTLYPGFYFKVRIINEGMLGRAVAAVSSGNPSEESFEEVTGLSFTIESSAQFHNNEQCAIPTGVNYSPLVLKRAFLSPNSELLDWCTESIRNGFTKITLKTIIITLMNINTGEASAEWKVHHAYPLKYQVDGFNSNQSQLLMETIEIRYQKFEVVTNRILNKVVSVLNKTPVGRAIVDNLTKRKENAIKDLKNKKQELEKKATETANNLLDKVTPDFLKTKIDPTKAVTDPNELARLKKLAEQAAKKAKAADDKKAADDAAAAKKADDEESAKKAEEDKKVAMAKKLAEEAAKKLTETKPEPKKEEKKPEPKKEEKKPEPKKEEKKPEPKKEEKKPEPKKEEKPKTAKERVAERQKAAEKKHIENQQKGRDNKNKGGKK